MVLVRLKVGRKQDVVPPAPPPDYLPDTGSDHSSDNLDYEETEDDYEEYPEGGNAHPLE